MIDTQEITIGTDYGATVTVKDSAGAAVNLTGASATFRLDIGGTVYSGATSIATPASGVVGISIPNATTATFPAYRTGSAQVLVTFSGGTVAEILRFPFRTIPKLVTA